MQESQQHPFLLEEYPVMFPPTSLALTDPDGLLAVGGALTPEWLLTAYSKGLFPWFNRDEPILWWTPNPRCVLHIKDIKVRRSLRKVIRQKKFTVTFDTQFEDVVINCANIIRNDQDDTWITEDMLNAYYALHQQGQAHSVEVWQNIDGEKELVGGLYGVAIGSVFFGESMFAKASDASKIALVALGQHLKEWGFNIIDTQVETPHLLSMGATHLSREAFEAILKRDTAKAGKAKQWVANDDWDSEFR